MVASNSDYSTSRHRRVQADAPARAHRSPLTAQQVATRIPTISDEQSAPAPINVDPAQTGSFRRITSNEGARAQNRESVARVSPDTTTSWAPIGYGADMRLKGHRRPTVKQRQHKIESNRNLFVGLGVAAVVVLAILAFVLYGAISSAIKAGSTAMHTEQVAIDQNIGFNEETFQLQAQDDGSYVLVRLETDGSTTPLFTCPGTPVKLIQCNGALVVPENLDDGWDVLAYMVGASSEAAQVVDADGNPIVGSGSISSAELEGTALVVTDSTGARTTIPL